MGEKFREFTLDMFRGFCFYCVSIYILLTCIITLYVCAWLCLFPYINSLEVVVFNYQNGGRLLEHISPYVVLVIDDNSYGLMVALSYIYRICP